MRGSLFIRLLGMFMLSSCLCVAEVTPKQIQKNAHLIDLLVAENFRKVGIEVPKYVDEETFVRRAYLVAIGRIPTATEVSSFLETDNSQKRKLLISRLYETDGYRSHMTNWYYDIFTLREKFRRGPLRISNDKLIDFIRDAAAENMAWDELCKELLTTKGNVYTTSGAAGYFLKGDAPDDHLSNTMRVFTGVRMECAQCHDDPFQEWEQMDFYNLKAFVEGPEGYIGEGKYYKVRQKLRELQSNEPEKYIHPKVGKIQNLHERLLALARHGTDEEMGKGRTRLPDDYQYRDGDPGEYVNARTPFGKAVSTKKNNKKYDSLEQFANWMTDDKTTEFSITISNRMWERVMGISLTPITGDYVNPKRTNFPQLINKLAQIMKDYDYDLKAFQKTLMSTRTFQFISSEKDLKNGTKNALDGRRTVRMSAEQIWDSLISLTVEDPDALPKRARSSEHVIYAGQYLGTKAEIASEINKMTFEEYEQYIFETFESLTKGEFEEAELGLEGDQASRKGNRLRRASEIPTPAGGFLKSFGQSDRNAAIDAASKEGTVSQDDRERIETTFRVVLSRAPDESEMDLCLSIINDSKDKKAAFRNIVAGIISSQEFYFIR